MIASSLRRIRSRAALALACFAGLAPAALVAQTTPVATAPITLGDAARLAAKRNTSAEVARLRADQAEARVSQRRADLMPNVFANALETGRTFNPATFGFDFPTPPGQTPIFNPNGEVLGPVNTLEVRGHLSQTLFDPAAFARVKSARATATAGDVEADAAALQAAGTAATAYVRVLRAVAQIGARTADSTLADDLLRIARDQLRAGVGVALDVTRAESQLANIRSQLIVARNERDRAQLDLARILGVGIDTRLQLADSLADLPIEDAMPDEAAAVDRALKSRPDLRALEEQLRAADRQVAAIRAERLPSVSAFGDQGNIGTNGGNFIPTFTWGVQLSVPIFDGFRREGRIQEQESARREVDVRRRDLREQAATDVRAAILDIGSAREQLLAARGRLRLAEQEVSQARDRFTAGVAGNADVITSFLTLNAARTSVNDALAGYQQARVALARAEGTVLQLR
jgi:outer membrane protein